MSRIRFIVQRLAGKRKKKENNVIDRGLLMENLQLDVLNNYPKMDEELLDELLNKEIEENDCKIVVLDDDPTGVQTIHDFYV